MPTFFSRFFFFLNDTPTTKIYTFSLHDALPISRGQNDIIFLFYRRFHRPTFWKYTENNPSSASTRKIDSTTEAVVSRPTLSDRKSTRLNSSHMSISYAVFCLKKKKNNTTMHKRD